MCREPKNHIFCFYLLLFLAAMRKIKINTDAGKSMMVTGPLSVLLKEYLPEARIFIITDDNVRRLYGEAFPQATVLSIIPGEQSKTVSVIEDLCHRLISAGADRHSFILGFGGGVVCDLSGVVASLYMRGVRHGFVSTTLLSQVDASIGGKNGVNLGLYKNIIGTFKQPEFVICDQEMLASLPEEEYISGVGELIKHAVIRDRNLFFEISENLQKLLDRDPEYLEDIIFRSVKVKARIVASDPHERGLRMMLNFGHTFGHPLEMTSGLLHGIAVMKGMAVASELSVWAGELQPVEHRLLLKMLSRLGIPTDEVLPPGIMDMIARDKKSTTGYVYAVLLRAIGKAVVRKISLSEIEHFLKSRNAENNIY